MKFRISKKTDFDFLWKVLTTTPELQSNSDGNTYDKKWLKEVLNTPKDNLVLIADENGEFIGFGIVHYLKSVKQLLVNDLYIVKDYRKRGMASKFMKEFEKDARKKKFRYLTGFVRTNNKKMQNLKEKLGYKKGNSFYFYEKRLD